MSKPRTNAVSPAIGPQTSQETAYRNSRRSRTRHQSRSADATSAMWRKSNTKKLSVNYIYLQMHLAERDDRGGEVVEREEAALKLLLAHQQLSKPVKPPMADLNDPSP